MGTTKSGDKLLVTDHVELVDDANNRWRWRRRVGAFALFFVAFIMVTGFLLRHAEILGLEEIKISSPLILKLYGMQPAFSEHGFNIGDNRFVTQLGSSIFLNDKKIVETAEPLVSAVKNGSVLVVATSHRILFFSLSGDLLETVGIEALPKGTIEALSLVQEKLIAVKTSAAIYLSDEEMLNWYPLPRGMPVLFKSPESVPAALQERIIEKYEGPGISLANLLLDLHSGAIFGRAGALVIDITVLSMLFLAVAALWGHKGSANGSRTRSSHKVGRR